MPIWNERVFALANSVADSDEYPTKGILLQSTLGKIRCLDRTVGRAGLAVPLPIRLVGEPSRG
jgi:hypothetical protein